jgi:hypothetical protein
MMSIRAANMFRRLFMLLSLFAAASYSSASSCFATNAFTANNCVEATRCMDDASTQLELSAMTAVPERPLTTELNVVSQTQTVSMHCDNRSQSFIEVPAVSYAAVYRKMTASFSAYIFYTELDNKFLATVQSLQTLK